MYSKIKEKGGRKGICCFFFFFGANGASDFRSFFCMLYTTEYSECKIPCYGRRVLELRIQSSSCYVLASTSEENLNNSLYNVKKYNIQITQNV